ncbi:MAG TPA: CAP domain-containing protein [Candidatus Paceibacterota bacterium]|nr:CAP domain-containing protein [Candidatus Paceibacterota bacterium]
MKARRKAHKHRKHAGHHLLGTYGTIALTLVSVVALAGTMVLSSVYLGSGSLAAVISSTLVDLTNTDRAQGNLGTLTVNPELVAAAQAKADDMAAKGYFAHESPDGKTSWYWFEQEGYKFSYAGENLAVDFTDSNAVENAWMNSPTHRANILNAHFTQIGVASAVGTYKGHETTFVVQMFGTPAKQSAPANQAVVELNPSPAPTDIAVAKVEPLTSTPQGTEKATTIATSAPTVAGAEAGPPTPQSAPLVTVAAAPVASLRDMYLIIGGIVLIALLSITGLEFGKKHTRYMATAAFLFVLMSGLYFTADRVLFTTPVISTTAAAAVAQAGVGAPITVTTQVSTSSTPAGLPFTKKTILSVLYVVAALITFVLAYGVITSMPALFIGVMGFALAIACTLILLANFTSWLY